VNKNEAGDNERSGGWAKLFSNPITGISLGAGIGIIWGGALGNPGIGLVLGAALGLALMKIMKVKSS